MARAVPPPVLLWHRLDLRLADQPALRAALASGGPVLPVYVWDPAAEGDWAPGRNSRWWLGRSLKALDGEYRARGSRLLFRQGETGKVLLDLARGTGAREIHFCRRYEPFIEARDARLARALAKADIRLVRHEGNLLREPESLRTGSGGPYKVFTPYWRAFQALGDPRPPLAAPRRIPAPVTWPGGPSWEAVAGLLAAPSRDGIPTGDRMPGPSGDLAKVWSPGSEAALRALRTFLEDSLAEYPEARDTPADPGTSHLSPHLHFGEITPRQIFHAASAAGGLAPSLARGAAAATFRKELGWREFAHHILVHFPDTVTRPLRPEFAAFPWRKGGAARKDLEAWRMGRTGYPFIDAGQRELLATGSMHNRARMATASFLVKDLLLPWQEGARWFWDHLVDADLAVNTLNWQWAAGCGADAAPYFRIFNPVAQGERFDSHGDYVRRWVPELEGAESRWIHRPFEATPLERSAAGIDQPPGYPDPLVDHARAREAALRAFRSLR
jgi:deoxyribodipyrimidine photo-lyase